MSLPSSMADFVARDRLLQKAYWKGRIATYDQNTAGKGRSGNFRILFAFGQVIEIR